MRRLLLVLAAVALMALGCTDDGDDEADVAAGAGTTAPAGDDDAADDEPATTSPTGGTGDADYPSSGSGGGAGTDAAAGATVALAETSLGPVLTGPDGRTLYLFTRDSEGTSACSDQCAEAWPPLTVTGEPGAGDGVDAALLGTIERADGSTQVTYNGHPLYYYASDAGPGDVNGQGANGVWFVVDAEGQAVQAS